MYNYITNVYIFVSGVSLVEQMFPNLPVHMSSLVMLRGIRAAQFLFFCIVFYLDILLSSYSRLTSSDYSFRIFKLLFYKEYILYVTNIESPLSKNKQMSIINAMHSLLLFIS